MQPDRVRSDSSDTYWKISGGPPADGLGAVVESYAVRAGTQNDDAQDGGAVSALLIGLLAAGEIDGALVSKPSADPDEQWKGIATIATTADEIRAAVGQLLQPDDGARRARPLPLRSCPPSRASPSSARRARSRACAPCRPAGGRPARTGSTRSSSPSPSCAPRTSTTRR